MHRQTRQRHRLLVAPQQHEIEADQDREDLDLVLSDAPVGLARDLKATSRLLGQSGVTLFGTAELVHRWGADFPRSLDGAPILLPDEHTTMRRRLEAWFHRNGINSVVVAEFGDSALLKAFGQEGAGLFPAPSMILEDVVARYGVLPLGELVGVHEQFYAITMQQRPENAAVQAVVEAAGLTLSN